MIAGRRPNVRPRPAPTAVGLAAVAVFAAFAACAGAVSADDGRAAIAKRAPRFLLETPSGGTLTLANFTGKPLVINAFASWCPPCRRELPLIAAAARRSTRDVSFVGVDEQEANEIATAFAKRMRLPYPIAVDHGQFAASYDTNSLPVTIFIDARGFVRAIQHGEIDAPTLARDLARIVRHPPGAPS